MNSGKLCVVCGKPLLADQPKTKVLGDRRMHLAHRECADREPPDQSADDNTPAAETAARAAA